METKRYTIDRIEGEYAVCVSDDCEKNLDIPAVMIPEAREGLCLEISFRDDSFSITVVESSGRKEKNQNRLRNLFNKSESGSNED